MLLNIEQTGEPPKSLPHPVCEEKPNPFHFPFKIRRRWLRCGQGGTCSASWTPNSRRVKGLVVRGGESDSFGVDQFDIEIHLNWRKSDDDVKNKHVSFCALSDSRIHKLNEQRNEFSVIIYWVVEKREYVLRYALRNAINQANMVAACGTLLLFSFICLLRNSSSEKRKWLREC